MPFSVFRSKFRKPVRYVEMNTDKLAQAIETVLSNGGRSDFDSVKVYEVKNILRIDVKITEAV